jgi:hypothetical protein
MKKEVFLFRECLQTQKMIEKLQVIVLGKLVAAQCWILVKIETNFFFKMNFIL